LGREYLGFIADLRQPKAQTHRTILVDTIMRRSTDSKCVPDVLCSISL
jgi:hypothetical protein